MPYNGEVHQYSNGRSYIYSTSRGEWCELERPFEPPPPAEGQLGDAYLSSSTRREFRLNYGGGVDAYEAGRRVGNPTRRRQPTYIYRTVVDNKIKYKGTVYTARNLKGKLDGKRFYFKYYPNDELMVLFSTAVVHEGGLRRLPNSIMDKFHEENRMLTSDRYGDRIYEHWYPREKVEAEPEVIHDVDELPMAGETITVSVGDTPVDVSDWVYRMYHTIDANGNPRVDVTSPEPPRQRTPAEEAKETDEPAYVFRGLAIGHLSGDNVTILQDHTALFDDEREGLGAWGIDTDHIVGSTRHYWIMDDDSTVYKSTGQITVNIPTAVPNPEFHSTTLADGTELPDVDRVAMEGDGINTGNIIGSDSNYWIMRPNTVINRRTRMVYPLVESYREHWLSLQGNSSTLRALLEHEEMREV